MVRSASSRISNHGEYGPSFETRPRGRSLRMRGVSSASVVRAGHLGESAMVDVGADLGFEFCHIFPDLLLAQAAQQGLLQFLDLIGGEINRRHADIGDAEYDQFPAASAWSLRRRVLCRAERGLDHAGRHAGQGGVTPKTRRALELRAEGRGLVGELAALVELLDDIG